MTILRSLVFNVMFAIWTTLIFVISLPTLIMPAGAVWVMGRLWAAGTLGLLATIIGLRHQVVGSSLRGNGAVIYAAKHQSAWDTFIFRLLFERPAFVLKRELVSVPLLGWYLWRCRMIAVDRGGGAKALKRMVAAAKTAVDEGRPIVIYPEGTRTAPGARRPYHPGIAALYLELGLPVVPVALNSGLFWGRRSFVKRPGCITLEFLPAIPPGMPRRVFMAELEHRIEEAAERLAAARPA